MKVFIPTSVLAVPEERFLYEKFKVSSADYVKLFIPF